MMPPLLHITSYEPVTCDWLFLSFLSLILCLGVSILRRWRVKAESINAGYSNV